MRRSFLRVWVSFWCSVHFQHVMMTFRWICWGFREWQHRCQGVSTSRCHGSRTVLDAWGCWSGCWTNPRWEGRTWQWRTWWWAGEWSTQPCWTRTRAHRELQWTNLLVEIRLWHIKTFFSSVKGVFHCVRVVIGLWATRTKCQMEVLTCLRDLVHDGWCGGPGSHQKQNHENQPPRVVPPGLNGKQLCDKGAHSPFVTLRMVFVVFLFVVHHGQQSVAHEGDEYCSQGHAENPFTRSPPHFIAHSVRDLVHDKGSRHQADQIIQQEHSAKYHINGGYELDEMAKARTSQFVESWRPAQNDGVETHAEKPEEKHASGHHHRVQVDPPLSFFQCYPLPSQWSQAQVRARNGRQVYFLWWCHGGRDAEHSTILPDQNSV